MRARNTTKAMGLFLASLMLWVIPVTPVFAEAYSIPEAGTEYEVPVTVEVPEWEGADFYVTIPASIDIGYRQEDFVAHEIKFEGLTNQTFVTMTLEGATEYSDGQEMSQFAVIGDLGTIIGLDMYWGYFFEDIIWWNALGEESTIIADGGGEAYNLGVGSETLVDVSRFLAADISEEGWDQIDYNYDTSYSGTIRFIIETTRRRYEAG